MRKSVITEKLTSLRVYSITSVGIIVKCTSGRRNGGSKVGCKQRGITSCSAAGRNRQVPRTISQMVWLHHKTSHREREGDCEKGTGAGLTKLSTREYRECREESLQGASDLIWNRVGSQGSTSWRTKQHPSIPSDTISRIWSRLDPPARSVSPEPPFQVLEWKEKYECEKQPIRLDANFIHSHCEFWCVCLPIFKGICYLRESEKRDLWRINNGVCRSKEDLFLHLDSLHFWQISLLTRKTNLFFGLTVKCLALLENKSVTTHFNQLYD